MKAMLTSWMEDPLVREYINRSISGSPEPMWPIDWFQRWLGGTAHVSATYRSTAT